jgi:hypothetical protein
MSSQLRSLYTKILKRRVNSLLMVRLNKKELKENLKKEKLQREFQLRQWSKSQLYLEKIQCSEDLDRLQQMLMMMPFQRRVKSKRSSIHRKTLGLVESKFKNVCLMEQRFQINFTSTSMLQSSE